VTAFYRLFLFLLASLALGLGSAWYALDDRYGGWFSTETGGWIVRSDAGDPGATPYSRAVFSRKGPIAAKSFETLYLFAYRDSARKLLSGRCSYRLTTTSPLNSAFWTLTAYHPDGSLIRNSIGRNAFDSRTVTRDEKGGFSINLSPDAQPGNWLPVSVNGDFMLILRLYAPAKSYVTSPATIPVPELVKKSC
jgi:hypothetical protein